MKVTDVLTYRAQDILHRILTKVSGSQSTISPVYGDSPNLPDTFYVDSGEGSDSNDGRDPAFPLATIDAAINKCTDSIGDVVIVQPGHAEDITAAIELDVIGVSIIGVGEGTLRPQLTLAADDNGIEVSVANCKIENIYFNERTTTPTSDNAYVDVSAANCKLLDLHFDVGAEDLDSITLAAGADSCEIGRCRWVTTANGPDTAIRVESIIDLLHVHHCVIDGGTVANGFEEGALLSGVVHTNCLIEHNTFHAIASGFGLDFNNAATGVIQYNTFALGTLGSMLDPGSCMCIQNFEQDAVDESGLLVPGVNPAAPGVGGAHGTIDDADTDTLHGKLGRDVDYADSSLWEHLFSSAGTGVPSWPSGLPYGAGESFAEVLAYIQDGVREGSGTVLPSNLSLYDLIGGAKGHSAWPTAAPYTNDVSLMEVVGYIQDQIRSPAGAHIPGIGVHITKVVNCSATADIFNITGLVLVKLMFAEVEAAFDANIANMSFRIKTVDSALCAATSVTSDLIKTLYLISGDPTDTLNAGGTPVPSMGSVTDGVHPMILGNNSGTEIIEMLLSSPDTTSASLKVHIYYIPLEASAVIAAA